MTSPALPLSFSSTAAPVLRRTPCAISIIGLFFALMMFSQTSPRDDLKSLIESELAFSRKSVTDGMRAAFLANLADDALVFRPLPVPGRKVYSEAPASDDQLVWTPIFADVSESGDLGYTTGPFEYRTAGKTGSITHYGEFVSIWRRQPDRSWRVVIDCGIPHAQPIKAMSEIKPPSSEARPERKSSGQGIPIPNSDLLNLDRAFSELSRGKGFVSAYASTADIAIRLYRSGHSPFLGKEAALGFLRQTKGAMEWAPTAAAVSEKGDLGYTHGMIRFTPGGSQPKQQSSYLRIWKRGQSGKWKLVLEVANPVPPSPMDKSH